ncbi:MAG TPA: MFS transporter [Gaiella sp.]
MPDRIRARRLTLAATALGSAIAFLDTTVVVIALPSMEEDLGLGLAGQQWVYLSYALALSALYLVSGAVGDRIGLRRTFTAGVVLFAAASLLCAVAPDEPLLLAGRALQGVGGAALTTTSLALLRVTWADESGRAIGLWTSLTSVATVAGPPLGGVVVDAVSWRAIFVLNLPLSVAVVMLAAAGRVPGEDEGGRTTLDLTGSVLAAVGLTGLTYALVELRDQGSAVVPAAAVGAVALAGVAVWTARAADPLVPPRLLRRPGLVAANLVTLVVYAALGAQLVFLPVYLQFLGLSPGVSGLVFVPAGLALIALAPRLGRYADEHGPARPITVGAALIGVGALLWLPVSERAEVWTWGVASLLVAALGLAAVVAPITAAALEPSPAELAGVASGLNQTVARVGGILSVAAVGALAGAVFAASGGDATTPFAPGLAGEDRAAGVDAFRTVVLTVAALAFAGSVLAASLLRRRPVGEVEAAPSAASLL